MAAKDLFTEGVQTILGAQVVPPGETKVTVHPSTESDDELMNLMGDLAYLSFDPITFRLHVMKSVTEGKISRSIILKLLAAYTMIGNNVEKATSGNVARSHTELAGDLRSLQTCIGSLIGVQEAKNKVASLSRLAMVFPGVVLVLRAKAFAKFPAQMTRFNECRTPVQLQDPCFSSLISWDILGDFLERFNEVLKAAKKRKDPSYQELKTAREWHEFATKQSAEDKTASLCFRAIADKYQNDNTTTVNTAFETYMEAYKAKLLVYNSTLSPPVVSSSSRAPPGGPSTSRPMAAVESKGVSGFSS